MLANKPHEQAKLDNLLAGLNWFAKFQIGLLQRAPPAQHDTASQVFKRIYIDKLKKEMRQNSLSLIRQFSLTKVDSDGDKTPPSTSFALSDLETMSLQDLAKLLGTFMPVVRLSSVGPDSYYLIGTEVKHLLVRGSCCMVRVGGGYVSLEEYYDKYAVK